MNSYNEVAQVKRRAPFVASLRASLKKEWLEALSTHRFTIIAIAFFGLAIMDPLMVKLLPLLLAEQLKGVDLSAIMETSQQAAVAMFISDLLEIAQFVLVLTLMGVVSQERSEKRLVIPVSMGLDLRAAYLAKVILYLCALWVIIPVGLGVAIIYGGMLFGFESLSGPSWLEASGCIAIYFSGVLILVVAMSELFKRPLLAGFASFFMVYGVSAIMGLWVSLKEWVPQQLIHYAAGNLQGSVFPTKAVFAIGVVCVVCLISLLVRKDYVAKSIN